MKKRTNNSPCYPSYLDAATKAYEVLSNVGINKLPVDLEQICSHYNIKVYFFSQAKKIIELFELNRFCEANNCFCLCPDGKTNIILVSDELDKKEQRLMIAHELGHILMGHLLQYNMDNESKVLDIYEEEADLFAITLLSPIHILGAINTDNNNLSSLLCDVPWYINKVTNKMLKRYSRSEYYSHNNEYILKTIQSFKGFIINHKKSEVC